jgi:general secretion pathway protein D
VDGAGVTSVNVDTVRRRTLSGTVVAQDGMAVALGGLIEESLVESKDQVPVLGDVPGLGFLFKRQINRKQRSELIVVIRPYVFNTPSESAATSEMMLSDLSLHPNAADASGTLNTYMPCEVVRTDAECVERAKLLQLHNVRK